MNKIVNIVAVVLIVSFPALSVAEYCNSSYLGKEFYAAGISDISGVTCGYRYCYYGCIYESYKLSGHYRPSPASKSRWEKVDGGYTCSDSSFRCEFIAK